MTSTDSSVEEEEENLTLEDKPQKLTTDTTGLSSSEAETRHQKYGYNEILEKKQNLLLKFLSYFIGPIPILIEIAAVLSLLIQHYADFVIILVLLLVNTIVSFWHDRKAGNAIEMLKKQLAPEARVLRDGNWQTLNSRELVPGDLVRLRGGDVVPADVQIIEGDYLECDESALTGESLPAEKHLQDDAYSGTSVVRGEVTAVVAEIGRETKFGKTTELVEASKQKSHFEKAVLKVGNFLIVMALFLVIMTVIVALFRGDNFMETLRFAMVLVVASIPVALPAILTITMAVGAVNLSRKKAIVSKLAAVEELAGMDILCSDKTGTLTSNQLTVGDIHPVSGFQSEDVILYGSLASKGENNDAIDDAFLSELNIREDLQQRYSKYSVTDYTPFDAVSKRSESQIEADSEDAIRKTTKGAPQVIFNLVEDENLEDYKAKVDEFASEGYRTIAVAVSPEENRWKLVGLVPLFDPPREDSSETIRKARQMGVSIKMITGDNLSIARQIASKLSLGSKLITSHEIEDKQHHHLEDLVEETDGFAEVYPEHKYSIVKILQGLGHFVGMTGDGVNDAPALKRADCGIAVSGATDAAKSAASIVFTAPGLSTIIDAIVESRKIFQRMNSYAIYRIAETVRVLFFIALSILAFNFYPVTAVMIVLLALLNDAPIIAIANDNVRYSPEPEKWDMKIVLGLGTFLGLFGVISSFLIFYIGKELLHLNNDVLQSFIFLKLAVAGHLTIFLARTRKPFWSLKPSAGLLWSAITTKILATLFAVYGWLVAPIGWKLALIVWGYAIVAFLITDLLKWLYYREMKPSLI